MTRALAVIALAVGVAAWPRVEAQRDAGADAAAAQLASARSTGLQHLHSIARAKGIDRPDDLVVLRTELDQLSMAHTRVQQYFRGVPVFGGQAISHMTAAGEVFGETDDLVADVSVDTTPRLTRDAAIGIATAHYGCTDCLTATPTADLWILRDREGVDRLTYRVQLARLDGTGRTAAPVRFVDAHGGDIVLAYDNLHAGTGSSIYSGTVTIGTHWNSTRGDFALENHGPRLGTFDARNSYALTSLFTFLDPDDVWDAPNQRAAVDVHYGLEQFFAYLSAVHGRNGIDGSGGPFTTRGHDTAGTPLFASVAHYGLDYANAFWYENNAYFGDGNGSWFAPLVTLDIVGHELMHGVTQYTAGLQHVNESGSISESWSDVFGAMLERHVRGEGDGTWRAGEEAFTPGTPGDALRYLDDPHRAPGTITGDDDPDHYSEACTPAHGGCWGPPDFPDPVYLNMGIASKAFFLLAKGGTHHLGGSMEGIGADEAARIWFLALTSYMTSSTGFGGARTATMQAATALFGLGSTQLAAVEYAWCLVGVGTCRAALDVISVTPDSGEGMSRAFTLSYSDSAGVTNDLGAAQVRFAETNDAARSCTVHYRATTGMVRMQDDDGNWGPWASFGGGMLANSQCSLDLAESAAATNGPNLTLTLDLTFARGFVGQKTVYMRAASASTTLSTGWRLRATWRVGAVVQATAVAPDHGIGQTQSFAFAYADDQGVTADLTGARVRFAAVGTVAAGSCTIDYNAVTDRVRLQDNAGAWGASVPFGSGTLGNSQCTLDLTQSGAASVGPALTLTLQITFAANFTGTKTVSMRAISATGTGTPWVQHGTWQVPSSGPNVVDVVPARASGVREIFTLHYWDESGAANLTSAQVKFAPSHLGPVDRSTCTVSYAAASATVSLMNDEGTGWTSATIGSGTLSNSQCTVHLSNSSTTTNGSDLVLALDIAFRTTAAGEDSIYMRATSTTGSIDWQWRGTWTVLVPYLETLPVTPSGGSRARQAFTLKYLDSFGAADLVAQVSVATITAPGQTCTIDYHAGTGLVRMQDDAGAWGAAAPLGIGTLTNSQCTLHLASSVAMSLGNELTLIFDIGFTSAFTGPKQILMMAESATGASSGWARRGSWTVPAPAVSASFVTPNSGTGMMPTLTATYTDSFDVTTDLVAARVRVAAANVAAGSCTIDYNAMTGLVRLQGDSGTWGAGVSLGSGTLSNSQCSLDLAQSTAAPNGGNLTVKWQVTFNAAFAGPKTIYLLARSSAGPVAGWHSRGTWTVGAQVDAMSATPASGYGSSQLFRLAYSDSQGVTADLRAARIRFAGTDGLTCTLDYNAMTSLVRMKDDDEMWGAYVAFGSGTLANSRCALDLAASSASPSGTDLTLSLQIAFAPAFAGTKDVSMLAASATGPTTGWLARGTWIVPGPGANAVSVTPARGHGAAQEFEFIYADSLGAASDLIGARVRFAAEQVAAPTCTIDYNAVAQLVRMQDDAGIWGTSVAFGSGSLVNSQCTLDLALSHAVTHGDILTLTLNITFSSAFRGLKQVSMLARGAAGSDTRWTRRGTWTPFPAPLDIGTLGGTSAYVGTGLNNHGIVVGYSALNAGDLTHAFSWRQASGMVDLGTLGGPWSFANAVNDAGVVAGSSVLANTEIRHAFVWTQSGGMVDLGTLGGPWSTAFAVNSHGQIVGDSDTAQEQASRAFSWSPSGGMVEVGTLGARSSATALNDSGQVIGWFSGPGSSRAFSWTRLGGTVDIGTLGGATAFAMALNANGQAVGCSSLAGEAETHAFAWTEAGGMTDLGTLGGPFSCARDVNDSGQIVGESSVDWSGARHGFLWTQATGMVDLGTLGGNESYAFSVNASGQIVGTSRVAGDPRLHPFLWTGTGGMVDLGVLPGAADTTATVINDNCQIVGNVPSGAATRGVYWDLGPCGP